MDTNSPEIDTQLYLRDGAPHATVCKVQMKDGRIGIGLYRHPFNVPAYTQGKYDLLAFSDALRHLGPLPESAPGRASSLPSGESDPAVTSDSAGADTEFDLQASLGQKAHD
jgi:hypothetical protein